MPPPSVESEIAPVRRVAVVLNARSGTRQAELRHDELIQAFACREVAVEFIDVADADALREIVGRTQPQACDVLVAVGGDGTVNTAANALWAAAQRTPSEPCLPLGIVAFGTFNYVARRYGLSQEIDAAVHTVVSGRSIGISAGDVAGRLFLNNCSLGLYTSIIDARERHKQRFGRSRTVALISSIATMLGGHSRVLVRIAQDGRQRMLRASLVFVGANPLQLDDIDPALAQGVADGALALVTVRAIDLRRLLNFIWHALTGAVIEAPEIEGELVQSVTLGLRRQRVKVVVDGELLRLPGTLDIRFHRDALRLRVSAEAEAEVAGSASRGDGELPA